MKIAHVCSYYKPAISGIASVIFELSKVYLQKGHEIYVYTSDFDKNGRLTCKNEIIDGMSIRRCFSIFKLGQFARFWPSVFFKIIKDRPDIVHIHSVWHPHVLLSIFAAKLISKPVILTTHCPWTFENRSKFQQRLLNLINNTLTKLVFKFVDKIIAITPWEMKFIKKYGGISEKIAVIPNGMNSDFLNTIKNNNFKKRYGIKEKFVLFIGRFNKMKGPDKLVESAKLVLNKYRKVNFVMIGEDEGLKDKVKEMAVDYPEIKILGRLDPFSEIIKAHQAAYIFALPSYREGLPLCMFEAMASGSPLVATPVNGIPYEMEEGKHGFLVEYGDVKTMADRILLLLKNAKLHKKISETNIKHSKNYAWNKIANKTLKIYNDMRQ